MECTQPDRRAGAHVRPQYKAVADVATGALALPPNPPRAFFIGPAADVQLRLTDCATPIAGHEEAAPRELHLTTARPGTA